MFSSFRTSLLAQTVKVCLQCGRPRFDPWVGNDPLEKEMATHSSTLARKIPWRILVGYSPWGRKESDMTERLHFHFHFLPRRNCLLISWLQSSSAVILEPKKRKSITTFSFFPSICHAVMRMDAIIIVDLIFSVVGSFTLLLHPHQKTL